MDRCFGCLINQRKVVSVPPQGALGHLNDVQSWSGCCRHNCAPLQHIFDPYVISRLHLWQVMCSVSAVVVSLLFVSVFLFCSQLLHVCSSWVELRWNDRNSCSDSPPHEELCRTVFVRWRSRTVGHESEVRVCVFLENTLDCPHSSLNLSVALWEMGT